jgi:hypothetical protein
LSFFARYLFFWSENLWDFSLCDFHLHKNLLGLFCTFPNFFNCSLCLHEFLLDHLKSIDLANFVNLIPHAIS